MTEVTKFAIRRIEYMAKSNDVLYSVFMFHLLSH